jgi:hypothetical protein
LIPYEWPLEGNSSPDGLYSDGLMTEVDQKDERDYISNISYALAVDLKEKGGRLQMQKPEPAKKVPFLHETIFLAVNILDRFLSINMVDTDNPQLAGLAAILIAAKLRVSATPQESPIKLRRTVRHLDNSIDSIICLYTVFAL